LLKKAKERTMKKRIWFVGVLAALCMVVLSGCASTLSSLGNGKSIGDETTVLYPDGAVEWAHLLDIIASIYAEKEATYQKIEPYVVWKSAGFDFEYDRAELTKGIQSGNYRIGKAIENGVWIPGYVTGGTGTVTGGKKTTATIKDKQGRTIATVEEGSNVVDIEYDPVEVVKGRWVKTYPDRPERYKEVEVKTIENRTVNVVDETKYQTYYDARWTEITDYIIKKLGGPFRDIADDEVFYFTHGGKVNAKKMKSIFQQQLAALPSGTVLINGGLNNDLVMIAEVVDGVLKCQISE
jgi:hypothetical protein